MRLFTRKLHSRRGASILLALLFFLVCSFVGAVVLGSAVTNVEKLQGRRQDQQNYYAVSSAARLIQTALDGVSCQGVEGKTIYQCAAGNNQGKQWDPALHSDTYSDPTFTLVAGDDKLAVLLRDAAAPVFQSQTEYTEGIPFRGWKTDFTIEAEDLPDVLVHMTINEAYTAVFTLQAAAEENTAPEGYVMTLTCPRVTTEKPYSTTVGSTCSHVLTEIDEQTNEIKKSKHIFDITEYTRITTVTWLPGMITKGVATNAT